jgi:hypothetical protein
VETIGTDTAALVKNRHIGCRFDSTKYALGSFIILLFNKIHLYAQRHYKLEVEAIEVVRDPSFTLQINQLRVSKYNATTNVINGNFTYIRDLPVDTMVNWNIFP